MPGINGMEEDGADSDYSMEGASGVDETIEGFDNMIELSLKGKSVDGQISIDEEAVLSSSLLVEQEYIKR